MPLRRLESGYANALAKYIRMPKTRGLVLGGIAVLLLVLVLVVAPKLPREVIGKPDTDWITVDISVTGNTLMRQMEAKVDDVEQQLVKQLGDRVLYTFTEIYRTDTAEIMLRLKDKYAMKKIIAELSEKYPNTPESTYEFDEWNPAELPLPHPSDFVASIRGTDNAQIAETARDVSTAIQEQKIFTRVGTDPALGGEDSLQIRPRTEQWTVLANQGINFSQDMLADLSRTATGGQSLTTIDLKGERMNLFMRFPSSYVSTAEDLGAFPVGVGGRILPLKALANISFAPADPPIMRENGRIAFKIKASGNPGEDQKNLASAKKAKELVEGWSKQKKQTSAAGRPKSSTVITVEDAQVELNEALHQLVIAVSLSIALIFLTMVFQFGSIMNSLLVLVAVPLGLIGVLISLFVFKSTLSLNSMLGVILLNGLSVANSIILVDFLQRKVREGIEPRLAAVEVARVRLRPILMTSMTTGLGMLPIALGFGEGGKILQPLGIAVAGGLGFSMVTTLFLVPSLQVSWLEWQAKRQARNQARRGPANLDEGMSSHV